ATPASSKRISAAAGRWAARWSRDTVLVVEDLHVYYGEIHALKGVSLHVGAGEIVAVLGPNGAGKTTTVKTISGLLAPRRGSVTLDDVAITGHPAHEIVYQ